MPDAFISMTTSWASGVGSGNCINSSPRSPVNTTPRIVSSACFCCGPILNPNDAIGKVRTDCELAPLRIREFLYQPPSAVDASSRNLRDLAHKDPAQGSDRLAAVLQDDCSGSVT